MLFHQNLETLRATWGISQKEMGKKFGVTQGTWSGWEKKSVPPLSTIVGISEFFRVSLDVLLKIKLTQADVPPRWVGRDYTKQAEEPPPVVMEPGGAEEVAELRSLLWKLQATLEGVVKQVNGLPALREEVEWLKGEVSALKKGEKG